MAAGGWQVGSCATWELYVRLAARWTGGSVLLRAQGGRRGFTRVGRNVSGCSCRAELMVEVNGLDLNGRWDDRIRTMRSGYLGEWKM